MFGSYSGHVRIWHDPVNLSTAPGIKPQVRPGLDTEPRGLAATACLAGAPPKALGFYTRFGIRSLWVALGPNMVRVWFEYCLNPKCPNISEYVRIWFEYVRICSKMVRICLNMSKYCLNMIEYIRVCQEKVGSIA